ncbi:MAG: hypothetical protein NTY33_02485 [Candidatus Moranbacteria bacterium]|nr:hypothetical protein [Candidatus Moranbacteria bacterium]
MSTSKKIFLISLTLFCVALLFFGIYNFAFKKPTAVTPVVEQKAPAVVTPQVVPKVSTDPIATISDEAVLAPTLVSGTNAVKYYSRNSGRVYQIDFDGNSKRTLSDKELIGLSAVLWSPDKNKVITKFVSAGTTKFYAYDYTSLQSTQLKNNVDEIAWQNTGNRIFYKYYDAATKKRTLNISDPDGTNWTKLADIDFRNISIAQIPQSGLVSFWNKPDAFFETTLKSVPLIGGEEKVLLKGVFGADYLWNANGTAALVSHSDAKGGTKIQLSLINSNGGEFRDLNLPSFASKCAWAKDNRTIYCAMPGEVPASAILPNDYDQEKFHTADTFWKIDTTTGEKNRIIDLNKITNKYDATDLFLNADESILFFTNRTDGKLYRITL